MAFNNTAPSNSLASVVPRPYVVYVNIPYVLQTGSCLALMNTFTRGKEKYK
jgi:hypothetical protein